jgi:DNA-binding beta-propeller fold protein YncE
MGSNANQLSYPNNFTVDATGNIYVADGVNNRIQKIRIDSKLSFLQDKPAHNLSLAYGYTRRKR